MAFVTANGVRLHVQRLPAAGPPVVLIHGLLDTLASYYFTLAGPLAAQGFDLISYDLRGHGRSERPPTGYALDDAVDDLAALLAELEVTGPVHLIGYSFGGTVAFRYAHRHPTAVASLVVIESEPPTVDWAARTATELDGHSAYLDDPALMSRARGESAWPILLDKMAGNARTLLRDTTAFADLLAPTGLLDDGHWLRPPLLLVVGAGSPLHRHLPQVLAALPPCTVQVIPGHGHLLLATAPQQVAAHVLPWLAALPRPAAR